MDFLKPSKRKIIISILVLLFFLCFYIAGTFQRSYVVQRLGDTTSGINITSEISYYVMQLAILPIIVISKLFSGINLTQTYLLTIISIILAIIIEIGYFYVIGCVIDWVIRKRTSK